MRYKQKLSGGISDKAFFLGSEKYHGISSMHLGIMRRKQREPLRSGPRYPRSAKPSHHFGKINYVMKPLFFFKYSAIGRGSSPF